MVGETKAVEVKSILIFGCLQAMTFLHGRVGVRKFDHCLIKWSEEFEPEELNLKHHLLPHRSNLIHMGKMEFCRKYTALLAKNTKKEPQTLLVLPSVYDKN